MWVLVLEGMLTPPQHRHLSSSDNGRGSSVQPAVGCSKGQLGKKAAGPWEQHYEPPRLMTPCASLPWLLQQTATAGLLEPQTLLVLERPRPPTGPKPRGEQGLFTNFQGALHFPAFPRVRVCRIPVSRSRSCHVARTRTLCPVFHF